MSSELYRKINRHKIFFFGILCIMRFVYKVCVSVSIRCHCIVNLIVTLLFVAADNSVMSTSDINNIKPIK